MAKITIYLVNEKKQFYMLNPEGNVVKEIQAELPKGWKAVTIEDGKKAISNAKGTNIYYGIDTEEKNGVLVPAFNLLTKYGEVKDTIYLKII